MTFFSVRAFKPLSLSNKQSVFSTQLLRKLTWLHFHRQTLDIVEEKIGDFPVLLGLELAESPLYPNHFCFIFGQMKPLLWMSKIAADGFTMQFLWKRCAWLTDVKENPKALKDNTTCSSTSCLMWGDESEEGCLSHPTETQSSLWSWDECKPIINLTFSSNLVSNSWGKS